jgi:hypothetical protein
MSGITTFTALRLDDKDVNDPNSGFYTAQATTEQINNIPADAKEEGELLYNKTTGKLVLLNGVEGVWETVNSYPGFTEPLIAFQGSNSAESNSTIEGEQVYYMPLDSAGILKAQDFTLPDNSKNQVLYTGNSSIVIYYTIALGIWINSVAATPDNPDNNVAFNLYLNNLNHLGENSYDVIDRIELREVIDNAFYRLSFSRSTTLNANDKISCGIETPDVGYTLFGINMTIMSI